ncbi:MULTISPECIES: PDR/VanB family oxidoreductase [Sinorhizobium]|uniref:PDR/VanB family oxidoreductase n=1 Tax=Sinorhizobium TaxID=28105 RepID=UPI000BEAB119|nr:MULTISPECIES: PDR/VanB family oxidoreductase [Sinorhizobium]PDT50877.1 oxidoreductase [Sinorhizobium sp. NG07B]POH25001.1 ferredoxin [Sinorhizobium americanum]
MSERDFELVVTCVEQVAKEVLRLSFARKDGADLPAWEAGAHIDLHFVSKGVEYVRQYSLCGRTSDRRTWQVAVLLVTNGRGGSAHIHDALAVGDTIRVTGPRNNFALAKANRYLFIAGGIGITPILPMIAEASATGADWRLVYCGRSSETMAFKNDVARYGPERVVLHASDKHGKADLDRLIAETDPETAIYCCGPESMLQAIDHSCAAHQRNAHMERFSASGSIVEGVTTAFEVEFARSGIVLTVPEDRSILEMAEDAGVDIDSSCQEGVCGSCETRVLSGTPDHRCSVLSAKERAEGKTMMVCVSRSCSARLVLDA